MAIKVSAEERAAEMANLVEKTKADALHEDMEQAAKAGTITPPPEALAASWQAIAAAQGGGGLVGEDKPLNPAVKATGAGGAFASLASALFRKG